MNLTYFIHAAEIFIAAYLIGSIPFGLLIGELRGIDVREHGSGNIGATNVTRVVGVWWGRLCFLLDFLKGAVPTMLAAYFAPKLGDSWHLLVPLAAFAAVFGHMFPLYLGFHGGKGVSAAAGSLLVLTPYAVLAALAGWVILFKLSKYVSLASIFAALILVVCAIVFHVTGIQHAGIPSLVLIAILAAVTILKHRSNIQRLLNGTENRFGGSSK